MAASAGRVFGRGRGISRPPLSNSAAVLHRSGVCPRRAVARVIDRFVEDEPQGFDALAVRASPLPRGMGMPPPRARSPPAPV